MRRLAFLFNTLLLFVPLIERFCFNKHHTGYRITDCRSIEAGI
jgi:hypothetical protein